ncbi:hypothetical protein BJF78_30120 [Pseudonocardia sp. CNS-139]|nr:hypothetical protein BJF78_30120 [Pseudonocardia sp. CNS-139]
MTIRVAIKVTASELEPGDVFVSGGAMVTEVWHDPAGTGVATDDGDAGYAQSETALYAVDRS